MAIRRRKKRRTHQTVTLDDTKVPRSFVFAKGKGQAGPVVVELVDDLRRMMEPHTASRLKARKHNRVRDFLHVAGQYNVNFFMIVSTTERGTYLRLARVPRGPTLQFRVHRFSLAADVAAALRRPHSPSGGEFATPPLLVLHGFSKTDKQDQLATVMFQNLFPPIDVGKMNIKSCRRVVLVHHDRESGRTHIRQYAITATPTGMTRGLKKLMRGGVGGKMATKLGALEDIAQLLDRDGYSSESGAETDQETEAVTLPQDYKGRGAKKSQQCAIKLTELGPRLELELLKIEEGVCEGNVIYHKHVVKTPAEAAELVQRAADKAESKAERKRVQEENIQRKAEAKAAEFAARGGKRGRPEAAAEPADDDDGEGDGGDSDAEAADDDMSDADWYRDEVGEEPEPQLFRAKPVADGEAPAKREKYNPLYKKRVKKSATTAADDGGGADDAPAGQARGGDGRGGRGEREGGRGRGGGRGGRGGEGSGKPDYRGHRTAARK
jgi:ribosome biogenesis protein SSF1/2